MFIVGPGPQLGRGCGAGELGLCLGTGWAAHGWMGPPEGTSCHGMWVSMARHLLGRIKRRVGWVVSSPYFSARPALSPLVLSWWPS